MFLLLEKISVKQKEKGGTMDWYRFWNTLDSKAGDIELIMYATIGVVILLGVIILITSKDNE